MRQDFETLKELNYNVVLQKPYNAFFDDGSLSIYCSINNIIYINVESNFNDYNIHKQMISKAIDLTS